MILLASLLACTGASPPPADVPAPAPAPAPAVPDDQIRALLAPDETLNRPSIVGDVGAKRGCISAVVAKGPRTEFELIVRCGENVTRSGPLQEWAGFEEGPIWLQDTDGDGASEVVVMASWMTGIGPTGAEPFQVNSVMRLVDGTLQHDAAAEAKVGRLESEAEVLAALKAR